MSLAIVVEACTSEYSGELNGRARVILLNVELVTEGRHKGTYRGPVVDVAEADTASEAIRFVLRNHQNESVAILTNENQLEFPDELSISEACEAYFGSRNKGLKF